MRSAGRYHSWIILSEQPGADLNLRATISANDVFASHSRKGKKQDFPRAAHQSRRAKHLLRLDARNVSVRAQSDDRGRSAPHHWLSTSTVREPLLGHYCLSFVLHGGFAALR